MIEVQVPLRARLFKSIILTEQNVVGRTVHLVSFFFFEQLGDSVSGSAAIKTPFTNAYQRWFTELAGRLYNVHNSFLLFVSQNMKAAIKNLTLSFALLGLIQTNPSFADGQIPCTTDWQTSNWTMDPVPQQFNRYYGLVGLRAQRPMLDLFYNRFKFTKDKSEFFPLPDGPYHERTLLEIQYTENHKSVLRFRFVEKNGNDIKGGAYSAWQTDNFQPTDGNVNLDQSNITQLNYMSEKFDKRKWHRELAVHSQSRAYETWDLLHSYPLVGMKRQDILDLLGPVSTADEPIEGIDYFRLSFGGCTPGPIAYLELKYSNDRVTAFRLEEVKPEIDMRVIAIRHPARAAVSCCMQGHYAEAESLFKRALQLEEKASGPNSTAVANCLDNLADVYRQQDELAEAVPCYERALQIKENALGANDPHLANDVTKLAYAFYFQGKYAQAEPLYKRSLQLTKNLSGPKNDPQVVASLRNLANLYVSEAKYAEAEPLFKQALAINEKRKPGKDSAWEGDILADQARDLKSLEELYNVQGKYAEAGLVQRRALAIDDRKLNTDAPDQLALVYFTQGKYADAEPLYKFTLQLFEKLSSKEPGMYSNVGRACHNLAALYKAQKRYAEAEPLYQRSLQIDEQRSRRNYPELVAILREYATLLRKTNRTTEAEKLEARAKAVGAQFDILDKWNDFLRQFGRSN